MQDSSNFYHILLEQLYKKAPVIEYSNRDKVVIFSDLHMGDGRNVDDFVKNSSLFIGALKEYYLPQGYTLILNGDIEEALKFNVLKIEENWKDVYELLSRFNSEGRLFKITGNHDPRGLFPKHRKYIFPLYDALRIIIDGNEFFVYHGHQSSYYYDVLSDFFTLVLRYLATPLGVRNFSLPYNSKKRSSVERKAYNFAKRKKIASIIGHTHRPLFESLSKLDTMKYKMEFYLREYQNAAEKEKTELEKKIKNCSKEIKRHVAEGRKEHTIHSVYSDTIILPCVFNSGAVMGKRGMTSVEISDGSIYLVHWFDKRVKKRYLDKASSFYMKLTGTDITRYILKQDKLDYLFAKIRMLG